MQLFTRHSRVGTYCLPPAPVCSICGHRIFSSVYGPSRRGGVRNAETIIANVTKTGDDALRFGFFFFFCISFLDKSLLSDVYYSGGLRNGMNEVYTIYCVEIDKRSNAAAVAVRSPEGFYLICFSAAR